MRRVRGKNTVRGGGADDIYARQLRHNQEEYKHEARHRGTAQRGQVNPFQRHHQRRRGERQLPLLHH